LNKIIQDIKKIKKSIRNLPSNKDYIDLFEVVDGLETKVNDIISANEKHVPTYQELNQAFADLFSNKSNWAEVEEMLIEGGMNNSLERVMEFMKNPLDPNYKKELAIIIKILYKKLI